MADIQTSTQGGASESERQFAAPHGSAHWQVFSDTLKREVAVGPAEMTVLTLSSLGALTLRIGAAGTEPRETCIFQVQITPRAESGVLRGGRSSSPNAEGQTP